MPILWYKNLMSTYVFVYISIKLTLAKNFAIFFSLSLSLAYKKRDKNKKEIRKQKHFSAKYFGELCFCEELSWFLKSWFECEMCRKCVRILFSERNKLIKTKWLLKIWLSFVICFHAYTLLLLLASLNQYVCNIAAATTNTCCSRAYAGISSMWSTSA